MRDLNTTPDRPVLKTGRLLLRQPHGGDIGSIIAIAGDWEVARRLSRVPHPYSEKDAQYFLQSVVPNGWTWAITWLSTGELVGMVGLSPEPGHEVADLGYYVARKFWGGGVATEAAGAVVDYGFNMLGLRRITSGHFVDNPSSGRVLSKLGFVEIGPAARQCVAIGAVLPSIEVCLEASGLH